LDTQFAGWFRSNYRRTNGGLRILGLMANVARRSALLIGWSAHTQPPAVAAANWLVHLRFSVTTSPPLPPLALLDTPSSERTVNYDLQNVTNLSVCTSKPTS
jgi:hypothetical protein